MTADLPAERQFDFWLGDWEVTWGEGQRASNRIRKILDGHAIQESFDGSPSLALRGMSLSAYSPRLGLWQQTWTDNEGNYWHFTGGFQDGRMLLVSDDVIEGKPVRLRMLWYNITSDELDWNWERSDDGGETWQLRWHLHYRRKLD
jgi:hypothetical protein